MRSILSLPPRLCRRINVILSDLDDTLTCDGKIPARTFRRLWDLKAAGITLLIVTGRPAGWAEPILRLMPVGHVIAENGGVTLSYDRDRRLLSRSFSQDEGTRAKNRRLLDRVSARILKKLPGVSLAADQLLRLTDVAFDLSEDRRPLDEQTVQKLEALARRAGLVYKISSIHLNAWVGGYTKETACRALLATLRRRTAGPLVPLYIGDSLNDEPMFKSIQTSVGVANIRKFADRMKHLPIYVTRHEGGLGFAEMAEHLLKNRR